jgi:nitronate monooxygenase
LEENIAVEGPQYRKAFADGDPDKTGVWFGEAAGIIGEIEPTGEIVNRMATDAARRLQCHGLRMTADAG